MSREDLGAIAREIVDSSRYMTLGTADENGNPWVSPVYYASQGYTEFYWISSPEVTHSRNLARRPHVSIVVFDSQQPPGTGRAVYMSAVAQELSGPDVDRGLAHYPNPNRIEPEVRTLTSEELQPPAVYASTAQRCRSTRCSAREVQGDRVPSTDAPSTIGPR